jgi:hypothetical protein
MAELQGPTPVVEPTVDLESIEDPDTTQSRVEHEDMVQYSGKTAAADSVPVNHTETNGTEAMQLDDASAALEVVSHLEKKNVGTSKTVAGSKPSMVVKPTAGTKNGPTSPLVKKVCPAA